MIWILKQVDTTFIINKRNIHRKATHEHAPSGRGKAGWQRKRQ